LGRFSVAASVLFKHIVFCLPKILKHIKSCLSRNSNALWLEGFSAAKSRLVLPSLCLLAESIFFKADQELLEHDFKCFIKGQVVNNFNFAFTLIVVFNHQIFSLAGVVLLVKNRQGAQLLVT